MNDTSTHRLVRHAGLWMLGALTLASTLSVQAQDDYPVNFTKTQTYTHASRKLQGVSLSGSADGAQSITIPSPSTVYTDMTPQAFTARAGEQLTATFQYSGSWMHGYVYLDCGQDGAFDATLNTDCTIPAGSDIMAFAYAEVTLDSGSGKNSAGASLASPNVLNPPSFTLPADLAEGIYRMRFKVDWAGIDPGGRMTSNNSILANGGGIMDVLLNVHGEFAHVKVMADGGTVALADGTPLGTTAKDLPFGQTQRLRLTPAEGRMCDYLRIRHGYHLDAEPSVHGNLQWTETLIPGYLIENGEVELPGEYLDGDVEITAVFVPTSGTGDPTEDYSLAFDPSATVTADAPAVKLIKMECTAGKGGTLNVPATAQTAYINMMPTAVSVVPGDSVDVKVSRNRGLDAYLYIDLNGDGQFSAALDGDGQPTLSSELVAMAESEDTESTGAVAFPKFAIHSLMPEGMYRARLKMDRRNTDPAGSATLVGDQGCVVDFLVNVHRPQGKLELLTANGSLNGNNNSGLPLNVTAYSSLVVVPTPAADGYVCDSVTVRHGHDLQGEQYRHGNRQWSEYKVPAARFTLPADSIDGDVIMTAEFRATDAAEYQLVFSDEFNAPDGTQEDETQWMRCPRQNATWNRYCSDSPEVIYHEDGKLVARAIPNPDRTTDNVPMLTGGIKTMGKFGFTYGKVECRSMTEQWTGTFPAIWMMPEDQSAGWPSCGEIDIFETIDNQNMAYHTVHSHWTYDLGQTGNPKSGYNETVPQDRYHTYGFEWDETSMRWYVDGKQVAQYNKSTDTNALTQGQWPFDKHFHLMINQSVGSGAWAAPADESHTYVTRFDWIRVYQKKGQSNTRDGVVGIHSVENSAAGALQLQPAKGSLSVTTCAPRVVSVCDLSGRTMYHAVVDGTVRLPLNRGIYIVDGRKVLVP